MAKDNKSAAEAAARAAEAQVQSQEAAQQGHGKKPVTPNANPAVKGLTQGEKVAYLAAIQTERAYIMNSAEKPSKIMIDGMSMLAQATILDIGIGEIASGVSAVGHIATINEKNYGFFRGMAAEMGVSLPEFKALPAPTNEQLAAVGLLPSSDQKMIVISKENVSAETVTKKKKEKETVAKAVENPAEIETNEQLKASLTALLVKPVAEGIDRPDARVQRTIKFYRGYLTIQANKAEDKEAALKEMKEKTMIQLLNEIVGIVGPCPFALTGTAYFLRKRAAETGSPISSFCLYRRSAVPGKDNVVDDQYIADIVKTLLIWSCNSRIAECEKSIKDQKKLVKNEAGAAKASTEAAIRFNEETIKQLKTIIGETADAKLDVVDTLDTNYNLEDTDSAEYKLAHRIADDVVKTYYSAYSGKEMTDALMNNVKQRAGIIVNMFRDPLSQSISYKESNLIELEAVKEEVDEQAPAEDNTKN